MPALRLLLAFAIVFSLVSLPSVLSNNFILPNIPVARAQQETTYGSWYPAGAQEQTLSISQGDGATGTQVNWLMTNQVDSEDWPLAASQYSSICPGSTTFLCSAPVADKNYFEIEFNLAGVFWGIPMQYGSNSAGIQLRQGIAHLLNKAAFIADGSTYFSCGGIVCVPNDNPVPPCSISSCPNGGLVNPNPCGWDTLFPETSSTNCVVGAPGGTAYNCLYSTVCPSGTVTGTVQHPGQVAIGSPDFCAAALHFQQAFKMQLGINVTLNNYCELVPPTGGWPSAVYAINPTDCIGLVARANVCFSVRKSQPRAGLGEGLAQEICALFSPAWTGGTGWTTLAGEPSSCDTLTTGTGNADCGGGY